jgi:predicted GIY-YIG superfamily endonuclease
VPFVYILRCADGSLYTGAAKDLDRRLAQHLAGRASRYTRARLPVAVVYARRVRTWPLALREERRLKSLRRDEKLALIAGGAAGGRTPAPGATGRARRAGRRAPSGP